MNSLTLCRCASKSTCSKASSNACGRAGWLDQPQHSTRVLVAVDGGPGQTEETEQWRNNALPPVKKTRLDDAVGRTTSPVATATAEVEAAGAAVELTGVSAPTCGFVRVPIVWSGGGVAWGGGGTLTGAPSKNCHERLVAEPAEFCSLRAASCTFLAEYARRYALSPSLWFLTVNSSPCWVGRGGGSRVFAAPARAPHSPHPTIKGHPSIST